MAKIYIGILKIVYIYTIIQLIYIYIYISIAYLHLDVLKISVPSLKNISVLVYQ